MKVQASQWLNPPIFADGSCDTLDQLVSVGLRPVCLTLYLLGVHRIHSDCFTHSYTSRLGLQNRTTIFENHYTMLRSSVLKYT